MSSDPLLQPYKIKNLRRRIASWPASHEPAYPVDGMPKELYRAYHVERAKAGVALTMTAAERMKAAGLDGLELQAYGHLIDQPWSPLSSAQHCLLGRSSIAPWSCPPP